MDGSGDGNIISQQRQQQLQQSVVMVVPQAQPQPQPQIVTTVVLPNENAAAPPAADVIQIPIDPKGYQQANDDDISDDEGENL
eukprot:CAMPEP_0201596022 /NCGR_PEP_ID=MMETSP0190_2-20130828/192839_1 /ASSEMBLY_ACC=CAM_ASM_000263 /TAXON_ID=37353 /ORGANISM="Rosalina sp." /LENGTH=82 /DNA_ID=CAMNT_0048056223 /DNA_START=1344 /DNA_END=1592 /DNA_ORIENTATION=+